MKSIFSRIDDDASATMRSSKKKAYIAALFATVLVCAFGAIYVSTRGSESTPFTVETVFEGLRETPNARVHAYLMDPPSSLPLEGVILGSAVRGEETPENTLDFAIVIWDRDRPSANSSINQWRPFVPYSSLQLAYRDSVRNLEFYPNAERAFGENLEQYETITANRIRLATDLLTSVAGQVGIDSLVTQN